LVVTGGRDAAFEAQCGFAEDPTGIIFCVDLNVIDCSVGPLVVLSHLKITKDQAVDQVLRRWVQNAGML
jgi:hypothetical protein